MVYFKNQTQLFKSIKKIATMTQNWYNSFVTSSYHLKGTNAILVKRKYGERERLEIN